MKIKHQLFGVGMISVVILTLGFAKYPTTKESLKNVSILGCYVDTEARCTGSAYCRACKNCSRCKHCSGGGSCGVCARGKQTRSYTNSYKSDRKTQQTKKTVFNGSTSITSLEKPNNLKTLLVNKKNLNVRSGPDISYYIIQQLEFGEKLSLISTHGKWIKIKVKKTKVVGFVHQSEVLLLED
ncbi:SH3 domain-containing protein [Tenacibaculum lutimaris]|uniref:SH3 domain-containing protein n=1 Tax=Tenacibaculum lutimaris TaxID=285258 RepID=A0A420DZU6_9FLAO|nr:MULTISPECIES: SH3 domain-containing protein [Tenacibaculum]RKF03375.1 SH3 domain-containing protein [Tenacibaculum lutimaris]